jgi:hypothetical protein
MPPKQKPLTREGEPTQTTEQGLEIPVPERREVFDVLGKVVKKQRPSEQPRRGKRRPSRDR